MPTATDAERPWNWAEFLLVQLLFGVLWAGASAGMEQVIAPRDIQWHPLVVAGILVSTRRPTT